MQGKTVNTVILATVSVYSFIFLMSKMGIFVYYLIMLKHCYIYAIFNILTLLLLFS